MNNYLLTIYPLLLIIVTFSGCRYNGGKQFSTSLWDKNQSKLIQAFACLGVILHHLSQNITGYGQIYKGPITILSSMGILFTAVFFFSSGYGLIISTYNNPNYLTNFIPHRFSTILVPFYLSNIVNILIRIYHDHIPFSLPKIVRCFLGLSLLDGNAWFIVEIALLYIAFFIIFRLIKHTDFAIVLLCIFTVILILIGYKSGHDTFELENHWFKGEWWYNSTIAFIMGLLFARFNNQIFSFIKRHYLPKLICTILLFIISFFYEEYFNNIYGYYRSTVIVSGINGKLITLLSQMLTCVLFVLVIVFINVKITFGNRILKFISSISLELFLIHGLFIRSIVDFTKFSSFIGCAIVITLAIISAYALHMADKLVITGLSGLKKDKSYLNECTIDLFREKKEKRLKTFKAVSFISVLALLVILGSYKIYCYYIKYPSECSKELDSIRHADIGDTVTFGKYDTDYAKYGKERLSWIVLDKNDNKVMLVTEMGITGSVYNNTHNSVSWNSSDLHNLLNNNIYNSMFSNNEMAVIIPNPDTGDYLSLLSVSEAANLFSDDKNRQIDITEVALKNGTNLNVKSKVHSWDVKGYRSSWWWLRGDGTDITAPIVTVDGEIMTDKKYVNKPNGAVRPVIWIDLQQ